MAHLAHENVGSGSPVVLFAHAFPMDRRMYRRQVDALAKANVHAIAPDLRGFGASRDLPKAGSIDDHADDLVALLDRLGVERAVVCGLSMGGYVALSLARRHASRLSGLLLADTKAGADDDAAKQARAANIERARHDGVIAVFDAMVPNVLPPDADRAVVEELRGLAAAQDPAGVVAALEAMRDRPDATSALASISVPTRVIVGSADRATPLAQAEILARAIPGAQLTVLEGAGHFTCVERPSEFNRVLLDLVSACR